MAGAVITAVVIGSCFYLFRDPYKEARKYLTEQGQKDVTVLQTRLQEKRQQETEARIQEEIRKIDSGEQSVYSLFRNAVLLGDSRIYGFKSLGLLSYDQVFAEAGWTIDNIPGVVDAVTAQSPDVIYLSFGVNDMGMQIGRALGPDGYGQTYEQYVKQLLEKNPNAKVVVNSILDPTPQAIERSPNWANVADYNRQIREMCERNGWLYVDNASLTAGGNAPIYQEDGVHFLFDFYPQWARHMLSAIYPQLEQDPVSTQQVASQEETA